MTTPKFKKQYDELIENNKELFDKLKSAPKDTEEFNELQRRVLRIVRRAEDALCSKTENTHFSNFSTGLADKFWEEIRANYPEIDYSPEE